MVIKMVTKLGRRGDELSENFINEVKKYEKEPTRAEESNN